MPITRRHFIKNITSTGAALFAGLSGFMSPLFANTAWQSHFFSTSKYQDTVKLLFGAQEFTETDQIKFKLPRIAENGAVVPVTVFSDLENVEKIALFVEKNPVPLIAVFDLKNNTSAFISARMKMAETSNVIAILKSGEQYYTAQQMVKVTIGGCGG